MDSNEKREKLLLRLIHLISARFKNKAILKGGMSLRLWNSPRYTQDIDFLLTLDCSRKEIAADVRDLLLKEGDIEVTRSELNSRGVFIDLKASGVFAEIEMVTASKPKLPPEPMTTAALAAPLKMPAQVITVMSKAEAYAHKIAAALERNSARDLYDISIYEPLTEFDVGTLAQRLSRLAIERKKPISISFQQASQRLKSRVENLKMSDFKRELRGLVPDTFFVGGLDIIRSCVSRLCQKLETLKD